ncbi:MAG TPA: ATP synthase subunit I [Methylomirabilota bacterium]|nr:ATP synthase subunit I [Methylomirabilota bacterium]
MTTTELSARVTVESAVACAALALLALLGWGVTAGAGVAAAGALTIVNFRWLARAAALAAAGGRERRLAAWGLSAAGRFAGVLAAFALLFTSGWVHPVGVVVGLAVLPCAVVARGLAAARVER